MPTNRLGAVEPGVEYAIKRETSVYMLLHTHIHTELIVESDALIIIVCIFYYNINSLQDYASLSNELLGKDSQGQGY